MQLKWSYCRTLYWQLYRLKIFNAIKVLKTVYATTIKKFCLRNANIQGQVRAWTTESQLLKPGRGLFWWMRCWVRGLPFPPLFTSCFHPSFTAWWWTTPRLQFCWAYPGSRTAGEGRDRAVTAKKEKKLNISSSWAL